jgi:hypothetical protein
LGVTVSIESEIRVLTDAFPPELIDSADAFAEWGRTHTDGDEFRRGAAGKRWTELSPAFLEWHHDALVFFGPSSIATYLPAYLMSLLRRDRELSAMPSFLFGVMRRADDPERFDARFAQLTVAQRRAVTNTLLAYERDVAGTARQQDVTDVLDGYWRAFSTG